MNDNEPLAPEVAPKSRLDFAVVGVGASAGGIAALVRLFEGLPAEPNMAFVVVMHLSPAHDSSIAEVLQHATRMKVLQVHARTAIERDHVYVIPPGRDLAMFDGSLALQKLSRTWGAQVAIDVFFRSLADAHGDRAVGIVLSGTGSDGCVGISRLKQQGGIVIAQSPDDAEYGDMPQSAIDTGHVDFVLPVADMPARLLELWQNARVMQVPTPEVAALSAAAPPEPATAEEALLDVMAVLHERTGHDFSHYKRGTVLRRIERRMQVTRSPDVPSYLGFLRADPQEPAALLDDMLIGVTNFFRDSEVFDALARAVVPTLVQKASAGESLRVWVPGCATGEEAYSIAMVLSEAARLRQQDLAFQIFATDIDVASLAVARKALYPEAIAADVSPARLQSFFKRVGRHYQVARVLRDRVVFALHDILRDPPFSRLDMISCRNLLIYLDKPAQADILQMFDFALRPEGILLLGSAENALGTRAGFKALDKRHRIYQSNTMQAAQATRTLPKFPLGSASRLRRDPDQPRDRSSEPAGAGVLGRANLYQEVLDAYAPPAALVSRDSEVLHLSSRAGRYLRVGRGVPSRQLVDLIQPELRSDLRSLLYQAAELRIVAESRVVPLMCDGKPCRVKMTARPVEHAELPAQTMLVLFEEPPESDVATVDATFEGTADPIVGRLEADLERKDNQLRALIEQHEASVEELKASNEELQSINEEVRSTAEELETSKEELQSTNEELLTVNQELKLRADEAASSADDLKNLIDTLDIATIIVDSDLRIKRYTPATLEIFNLIQTDEGRRLSDITHRLEYGELAADAARTFSKLRPVEREVKSSDGRYYLARFLPYRSTHDRIEGVVLSFVDITRSTVAERAVRMGEERMQLVAANMPDFAILTLDESGRITSWSAGAASLFGWSEEETLNQSFSLLFLQEDREQGIPEHELRVAAAQGKASDERWHLRKDGSTFFSSGMTTQLRSGALKGYAKIAFDATRQRREESQRESLLTSAVQAHAQAASESEIKSDFLAVMSHELKHPLNLINVNIELLTTLPQVQTVAPALKIARTIQKTVQTQARIIDDLLDLSRSHAGKLTVDPTPMWLGDAIEATLNAARREAFAKGLKMSYQASEEPLLVQADSVRLEQILWNLLSNAIKFTRAGGSIDVRLAREGDEALIEVRDSGHGISPSFLPHVFDLFKQADAQTTRQKGGLGIGLALVAGLVNLHGGRVAAESPGLNLGATFKVWLPLHKTSNLIPHEREPAQDPHLAGLRVLLVEDMPDTLEVFVLLLESKGLVVSSATSGQQALELADTQDFDLIISDIGMPGMDGYELIERLRSKPRTARLPAIALTGYGRPQEVQRALRSGFSAHVDKPVKLGPLLGLCRDLVSGKKDR